MINKNKYSIAAAIITKNEEDVIANAINSVKELCQQIVVVDTGSTDNTAKKASQLGCEVYFHSWNNDFSEARNKSLQYVKSDWIIILDSDEELDSESLYKNLHLLESENCGAIRVTIKNILKDTDIIKEHKYPRIIRNNKDFLFTGKIHEQISESILESGFEIIDADIVINHYGYSKDDIEKVERNLKLLNEEIESKPDDDWQIYHLAETEFTAKKFDDAHLHFSQILDSNALSDEQNNTVKIRLAQILVSKNQFNEAIELLNFTSIDEQLEGLRKYVLTSCLIFLKKFKRAEEVFRTIIDKQKDLLNSEEMINIDRLFENIRNMKQR